jgi:transcription antitermination factor NusG
MLSSSTESSRQVSATSDWYAIYTRHQHEKIVACVLENKGFATLLPLYEEHRRWRDRVKLLSLPLFPCYVFIKGGLDRRLDILTTPGIHSFVSSGGQPAPISSDEIGAIQRGVDVGARFEPHSFLKRGEQVRVKSGSLEGVEGILVRQKGLYRLVLSVEILGKAASVEVDIAEVERVKNASPRKCRGRYGANGSLLEPWKAACLA